MPNKLTRVLRIQEVFQISDWHERLNWNPFGEGVDMCRLYGDGQIGPTASLIRFHPGGRVGLHEHLGYEHILVLAGSQLDENSRAEAGTLIINPPGTSHSILSETGCLVLAIYEKPVRFLDSRQSSPARATNSVSRLEQSLVRPPPVEATPPHGVCVLLAVNGTLMRGLELNPNLLAVHATFVRETKTASTYRLWSIGDRHPAMVRVATGGVAVTVEVWSVPAAGLATILLQEPAGLSIGKVELADGSQVLGVLGEPILCEGQREITAFGGWREYRSEP